MQGSQHEVVRLCPWVLDLRANHEHALVDPLEGQVRSVPCLDDVGLCALDHHPGVELPSGVLGIGEDPDDLLAVVSGETDPETLGQAPAVGQVRDSIGVAVGTIRPWGLRLDLPNYVLGSAQEFCLRHLVEEQVQILLQNLDL